MKRIEDLQWDDKGLLPAVVQDADTGEILTLAYVSRESLLKTCELGETVFYSRSRKKLWHKGETSGNFQKVVGVSVDCDGDALVIRVKPEGPACHTGARSCFFERVEGFSQGGENSFAVVFGDLERLIASRKELLPADSHTTRLFQSGAKRIFQKVGEEAVETVIAGVTGDRVEMIRETSDLVYHLLVALREMNISLDELAGELDSRRRR
jgi:phosphoribosyl-AMP cyclohydrolase / phosphoribosyl-ATP pyrophosphohydrolase